MRIHRQLDDPLEQVTKTTVFFPSELSMESPSVINVVFQPSGRASLKDLRQASCRYLLTSAVVGTLSNSTCGTGFPSFCKLRYAAARTPNSIFEIVSFEYN